MTHIVSRTPLKEGSARRREFYLTTHTKHYREMDSQAQVVFEHAIPACEWPQTQALDRAVTGSAWEHFRIYYYLSVSVSVYVFNVPLRTSQETQKNCISIRHNLGLDRIKHLGCKMCDMYAVFQVLTPYFSVLSQQVAPSLIWRNLI